MNGAGLAADIMVRECWPLPLRPHNIFLAGEHHRLDRHVEGSTESRPTNPVQIGIARPVHEAHGGRAMNFTRMHPFLGAGLAVAGLSSPGLAAEPLSGQPPRSNYQIEIEVTPKDGTPHRLKVVTAGERVHASFLGPAGGGEENEAPTIFKFEAEFELLESNRVWLRTFNLGQHVPVVMGTTRSGFGGGMRDARAFDPTAGPDAPAGAPGDRPRTVERRRVREPVDGADPQAAEGPPPARNTPRLFSGPPAQIRQVQVHGRGHHVVGGADPGKTDPHL